MARSWDGGPHPNEADVRESSSMLPCLDGGECQGPEKRSARRIGRQRAATRMRPLLLVQQRYALCNSSECARQSRACVGSRWLRRRQHRRGHLLSFECLDKRLPPVMRRLSRVGCVRRVRRIRVSCQSWMACERVHSVSAGAKRAWHRDYIMRHRFSPFGFGGLFGQLLYNRDISAAFFGPSTCHY